MKEEIRNFLSQECITPLIYHIINAYNKYELIDIIEYLDEEECCYDLDNKLFDFLEIEHIPISQIDINVRETVISTLVDKIYQFKYIEDILNAKEVLSTNINSSTKETVYLIGTDIYFKLVYNYDSYCTATNLIDFYYVAPIEKIVFDFVKI